MPVSVLAESLRVVPVLIVEVGVPVHEPHDRHGPRRCDRNLHPERVVDALRVDIRVVPAMTERNDAEAVVRLHDQAAFNPLDGIRVRCAYGDAPVEVVTVAGVLFFLDRNEYLPGLIILPSGALGLLLPLQLVELFLPKTVVAFPVLSTLRIIVVPVGRGRLDCDLCERNGCRGQPPGADGGPIPPS